MTWYGQRANAHALETFPDGVINGRQLHTILSLDDRHHGRIIDIQGGIFQNIVKLTDAIVEVHCRIGRAGGVGHHCALWMDAEGEIVASAVTLGEDRAAESYWRKPESVGRFGREPDITTTHVFGMWSLGNYGAVRATRKFIREHYETGE